MPGFNLITSNRLEHLLPVLAEIVQKPRKSPFTPETIIVQNRGMEQHLSLKLSELLGVWANCTFPFPSAYIQTLFKKALPTLPEQLSFDTQFLPWKLMSVLPDLLNNESYKELNHYVKSGNPTALFDLCCRIADQFDRYSVYRSTMLANWQNGEEQHWQADLWRKISEGASDYRGAISSTFVNHLLNDTTIDHLLPERLSIFGVSTLPPFHLDMFHALSQKVDIYYFLLNPCAEFWDDIIAEKELTKKIRKLTKRKKNITPDQLHFDQGNPLLASMGKYGQDFLRRLHGLDIDDIPVQVDPGDQSILRALQSDILNLRARGTTETPKHPFSKIDRSIQLHSCHTITRELEVLYDHLLDLFNTVPDLKPSDIVVMTPDINVYASSIEAVFGSLKHPHMKIPYTVSDRCGHGVNQITSLFLHLLQLPGSRFTASSIIELLDFEEIREAFSLSEQECELAQQWIDETGIRWGVDGESKQRFDCPHTSEGTWKNGLGQLILGFALPPESGKTFQDIFGYQHVEGSMSATLGNFISFVQTLIDFQIQSDKARTLSDWADLFLTIIDKCIKPQSTQEKELTALRATVLKLKEIETVTGYKTPINYELVAHKLREDLNNQMSDSGYYNGSVTFCSMLPMRGIPFRVIACIGINDSVFPRKSSTVSWDLIAANPQPGDRSLEEEDRYLFLEALCSARDIFYISFIEDPRGKASGTRRSVVVDELVDYCDSAFCCTNRNDTLLEEQDTVNSNSTTCTDKPSQQIVTRQRLQAYNSSYFANNSELFSFSEENCVAADSLLGPKMPKPMVISDPLPEPDESFRTISIQELIQFFCDPAHYFLTRRVGLSLKNDDDTIEDTEPFDLTGLEKYNYTDKLISHTLTDSQHDWFHKKEIASGNLPHGIAGELHHQKIIAETDAFISEIKTSLDGTVKDQPVILKLDPFTITGSLTNFSDSGIFLFRYGTMRASDRLRLWIMHLIAQVHQNSSVVKSTLLCKNDKLTVSSIDNPEGVILRLCTLYWTGLSSPLHFFPESSWAYAVERIQKQSDLEVSIRAVQKPWLGNEFSDIPGECDRLGNKLLFSEIEPFNLLFGEIAVEVFGELIESIR